MVLFISLKCPSECIVRKNNKKKIKEREEKFSEWWNLRENTPRFFSSKANKSFFFPITNHTVLLFHKCVSHRQRQARFPKQPPHLLSLEEWFIQNPFSPREENVEKKKELLFSLRKTSLRFIQKKKFKWIHSCSPRNIQKNTFLALKYAEADTRSCCCTMPVSYRNEAKKKQKKNFWRAFSF